MLPMAHNSQLHGSVVGYDANNDDTFSMNEKPAWLTSLDKTSSTGSITPENCTATLKTDIIDKLAPITRCCRQPPHVALSVILTT